MKSLKEGYRSTMKNVCSQLHILRHEIDHQNHSQGENAYPDVIHIRSDFKTTDPLNVW